MLCKKPWVIIGTIILALDSLVFAQVEQEVTQSLEKIEKSRGQQDQDQDQELGYIIVEPTTAVRLDYQKKNLKLAPYGERRLKWGKFIGLSVRDVKNEEYSSEYLNDSYDSIYGGDDSLGFELHTGIKRNYSWFSIGAELNFAQNKKKSDKNLIDSMLENRLWKVGAQLAADNIFDEMPYFAPYISGGVYQVLFKEKQQELTKEGSTQLSFYGTLGVMFSISWMDPHSAKSAYFDSGIENTYLFVEATYFVASSNDADPDFSGISTNAGLKVEF